MFDWNEAVTKKLRTLVAQGLTSTEIARRLHAPSRNSVIGKCTRLGLSMAQAQEQNKWTAEKDATLRRLWDEGHSTTHIASLMKLGSRGAVSARSIEMGLTPRKQGKILPVKPTISPVAASPPVPEPDVVVPLPAPKPVSEPRAAGPLHFLDGQFGRCRFPLWSNEQGIPIEQKFVCAAPAGSSAYCPDHRKICFGVASWGQRAWRTKSGGVSSASAV